MKLKIIAVLAVAAAASIAAYAIAPDPAPEVRFQALSGESIDTSKLRGKVVLVNFWATYCKSCLEEMPKLVEAQRRFGARGYETISVAVRRDSPSRVANYAASHALPFKVTLDTEGELARAFGNVRITPTSFLIDKNGKVLRRYVGEPDWTEFHRLVERELGS